MIRQRGHRRDDHAMELLQRAVAPGLAGRRVQQTCLEAGVPAVVIESASLVAGELVGISLRQSPTAVGFEVRLHDHGVEVRVHDQANIETALIEPFGTGAYHSLGLVLRLCQAWGMQLTASGRLLWAIVALPPELTTPPTASTTEHNIRTT